MAVAGKAVFGSFSGTNLRITVKLINVADGYNLWSEQYDRELKDIFSIQKEISENIVQALEINLGNEEKLAVGKTKNAQAYDFYLRGRDYFHQAHQDKLLLSIPMFKKAIEKDNVQTPEDEIEILKTLNLLKTVTQDNTESLDVVEQEVLATA